MGPSLPTVAGSSQIKAAYASTFGVVKLNLNFKIDEVIVGNNYGFVRSTSSGTATPAGSTTSAPEENRELFVVQKTDGQWKIARYIYNKMGTLSQSSTPVVTANNATGATDADQSDVRTLITATYANAVKANDAAAVAAQFSSDGVLMAPDAPTVKGTAAIQSSYQTVFGAVKLDLAFTIDDIALEGDYGYVRSHSNGTVTIGGQGSPASYREIFVVKKVDGKWKIAWYNYNQPA